MGYYLRHSAGVNNSASSTNETVTFSAPLEGSLLVCAAYGNPEATSLWAAVTTGWTVITSTFPANPGVSTMMWYKVAVGNETSFNATCGTTNNSELNYIEFAGAGVLDNYNSSTGNSVTDLTASITAMAPLELVVAAYAFSGANTFTGWLGTPGTTGVVLTTYQPNGNFAMGYGLASSTSITVQGNSNTATGSEALIAASFTIAPSELPLLGVGF